MGADKEYQFDLVCRARKKDGDDCVYVGDLKDLHYPLLQNFGQWQVRLVHLSVKGDLTTASDQQVASFTTDFCLDAAGRHISLGVIKVNSLKESKFINFDYYISPWQNCQVFKGTVFKVNLKTLDGPSFVQLGENSESLLLARLRVFTSVLA